MDDRSHMLRAIRLARRAQGYVEPNPMVGCVIVKGDRIVGQGMHRRFGGAHAEVNALAAAGKLARGATVYVTLEPCVHHGKTPPCADALIAAGIKRVVIGCPDPVDDHAGGEAKLREAGIRVDIGICAQECAELIAPFTKTVQKKMPWVIAKWAATIDGQIATRTGDSQWISGVESRLMVHQLRARVDAVIVGVGTALMDDPMLTARRVPVRRVARRVVIDPRLRLETDCMLLRTMNLAPLTLAVAPATLKSKKTKVQQWRDRGAEVVAIKRKSGRSRQLELSALLKHLHRKHEATNVLVEGGSITHGAFFDQKMIDELLVFVGPLVLGDGEARPPVDYGRSVPRMAQSRRMKLEKVRRIGEDVLMRYRPQ